MFWIPASRTVDGERRVKELLSGLPAECRKQARKIQSGVTFQFGNSGTLTSKFALILPAPGSTWIRIEVIPGETPLLISNRLPLDLDAVIHVKTGLITLGNGSSIATRFDERGLSIIDMSSLCLAPAESAFQTEHSALADLTGKENLGKPPTLEQRLEAAPQPSTTRPSHSETKRHPAFLPQCPRPMPPCTQQTVMKVQEHLSKVDIDEPLSGQEDNHLAEEELSS